MIADFTEEKADDILGKELFKIFTKERLRCKRNSQRKRSLSLPWWQQS